MKINRPALRVRTGRAFRRAIVCGLLTISIGVTPTLAEHPAPPSQPGHGVLVRELAAGKLLVAARNLPDPNFADSVVLLIQYSPDGAAGIVLNRPSRVPLARALPWTSPGPAGDAFAFIGGPVEQDTVLALSRVACAACPLLGRDVYLVSSPAALQDRLAYAPNDRQLRAYIGYAGWGAGQLDAETRQGTWHVMDGDAQTVFDPAPASLWQRAIRRAEAVFARLARPSRVEPEEVSMSAHAHPSA